MLAPTYSLHLLCNVGKLFLQNLLCPRIVGNNISLTYFFFPRCCIYLLSMIFEKNLNKFFSYYYLLFLFHHLESFAWLRHPLSRSYWNLFRLRKDLCILFINLLIKFILRGIFSKFHLELFYFLTPLFQNQILNPKG